MQYPTSDHIFYLEASWTKIIINLVVTLGSIFHDAPYIETCRIACRFPYRCLTRTTARPTLLAWSHTHIPMGRQPSSHGLRAPLIFRPYFFHLWHAHLLCVHLHLWLKHRKFALSLTNNIELLPLFVAELCAGSTPHLSTSMIILY